MNSLPDRMRLVLCFLVTGLTIWVQDAVPSISYPEAEHPQDTHTDGLTYRYYSYPNPDDTIGYIRIDHRHSLSDVFGRGLSAGWTNEYTSPGEGDVSYVRYKIYCYREAFAGGEDN